MKGNDMDMQKPEHPMHEELDRCYSRLLYLASGSQGIGYALSIAQEDDLFGNSVVQDLGCAAVALGEAIRDVSIMVNDLQRRAERDTQ